MSKILEGQNKIKIKNVINEINLKYDIKVQNLSKYSISAITEFYTNFEVNIDEE